MDAAYYAALKSRMNRFMDPRSKATFFNGDANEFVSQLPGLLKDEGIGHCMVFIDPEGMEWKWDSMAQLVRSVSCDLIVNFPSTGIQRNSTKEEVRPTIARFVGQKPEQLPPVVHEEWALQVYRSGLAGLGKNVSTEVLITDFGPYHYHLIPAVGTTGSGSPWFKVWMDLRDRVNRLHARMLEMVAQQIDRHQETLC